MRRNRATLRRRRTRAPAIRGSAFGLLATIQAIANFAASTVAGLLWTAASPTAAFGYLAFWMLIALIALGRTALHQD